LPPFFAFFLVAMVSILPSICHGSCNGRLLQLVECIESIKSDVKKKMTLIAHATDAPKSLRVTAREEFAGGRAQ
jgi:hypothetical protein